jgi:hypothetical protein
MHNFDGHFVMGYCIVRTIAASVAGGMLRVLNGAVLVISAVEGVQVQTRVPMRPRSTVLVPERGSRDRW